MAENYSRPASGLNFKFGGLNLKSPADKIGEDEYPVAQNIRDYDDTSIRNRPGLSRIATSNTGLAVTALRGYSAIETDNFPRYLFKSGSSIYLDTGSAIDGGYASGVGASLIPYRPNQSPQSYMYVGDSSQYRKISAPNSSNQVVAQKAGIAEPQTPVESGVSNLSFSYIGLPNPSSPQFVPNGSASAVTNSNRINDTVQGVYPDPTNLGMETIHVSEQGSDLPPGIYKVGAVTAHFFPSTGGGEFEKSFPLDPSTAAQTATGNTFNFNWGSFHEPSYMPMDWAIMSNGTIVSSFQPYSGATSDYVMSLIGNLYVPAAGNFGVTIGHDDGMFFAINGASLVSGPVNNPRGQTKTAVAGYSFSGGSPIAGTNREGSYTESFIVNFPTAGIYPIEVNYCQFHVYQQLNVYNGLGYSEANLIQDAGTAPGYQRYMALELNSSQTFTVQDVFPPLPSQIAIESIYYYSGNTGKCIVVPASLSPVPGTDGSSLYDSSILSGLRRGSLVQIGSEICYVLSVTNGPTGNVCFETTTNINHASNETLIGIPAIAVFDPGRYITNGMSIGSADYQFSVGEGIGAVTTSLSSNPFVSNSFSFQPEDYIHLSVNIDALTNLDEMKIMFDVGDGTFTNNFYFKAIRPNDIVQGVSNDLTQMGVAQLVSQRAVIDEATAAESGNQGTTYSSSQTTTGDSQWSEILFPISDLTRVGNDQSKSLQNAVSVQVLFNCNGPISVQLNSILVMGGFAPDVGDTGAPYQYVIRARSSVTGARSNPSPVMRYGVTSRRGQVSVLVPLNHTDPQADQWDIFRLGGAQTDYTYVGSVPIGSTAKFDDIYSDSAIASNDAVEYDNFEPWPTVDLPFNENATQIIGTSAIVSISDPTLQQKILRYLPGNLVQAGQQVYRLWTRPTPLGGGQFLFQFVENAGTSLGTTGISIYEPVLANQVLPYLWGPTEEGGNVFGCGDPLRPGFVYFCKNFQPDSAPDSYNLELCPPSEPLLGGETLNGNSYVASTDRWWQMRPSFGGDNHYTPIEAPVGRGLAAPFGHCTDGKLIYFVAKDGIYATGGGSGVSLTDDELYNLFPHEGISGQNIVYNGVTFYAPDYGRAESFRLAYIHNYLFFDYQDASGIPRTLVYSIKAQGWIKDEYLGGVGVNIHYNVEQQSGSLDDSDQTYPLLLMGGNNGSIYREVDGVMDDNAPIQCYLATREFTAGDVRAPKLFGDVYLDYLSGPTSSSSSVGLSVQFLSLGNPIAPTQSLSSASGRQQVSLDLSGGEASYSLGMFFHWTVPFAMDPVILYTWQPSYIVKPEETGARAQDWDNAGYEGAKWVQGFILEASTNGANKSVAVRNADDQLVKQVFTVNHPIQNEQAYSFTQPFVSHMLRLEPQGSTPWQLFNVKWIYEPTPETVTTWWSQASSLTFEAYGHVYQIEFAYAAGSDVNFTMFYDGSTQDYVIPATGGQYRKYLLRLRPNKGKAYSFRFQSSSGNRDLALWLNDMVFKTGAWGRTEEYINYARLGGEAGDGARV